MHYTRSLNCRDSGLLEQVVALLDKQLLNLVMKHTNGNRLKAAKLLGITTTSLRRKMNVSLQAESETDTSDELRTNDEHG